MLFKLFRSVLLITALLPLSGCLFGLASIRGSGEIVTVESELSGFTSLSAGHGCKLRVTSSETYSVVVRIDDNLAEHLILKEEDAAHQTFRRESIGGIL